MTAPKRLPLIERTMLRQFLSLDLTSFRIAYLLLYPATAARMKYGPKLRRLRQRLAARIHGPTRT